MFVIEIAYGKGLLFKNAVDAVNFAVAVANSISVDSDYKNGYRFTPAKETLVKSVAAIYDDQFFPDGFPPDAP